MKAIFIKVLALAGLAFAAQATAAITFYEKGNFGGQSYYSDKAIANFKTHGINDKASSAVVWNYRWEICEDVRYRGRCVVLVPGRYPSLAAMGLNNRVSSVRPMTRNVRVDPYRYAPPPMPIHDFRRRQEERLFEASVISVRAVVGPPDRRCWVEREQVVQERSDANVPGALAGALIGGILGHQIGGGQGQDIATAGGAVAGAVVGANVGRGEDEVYTRNVKHCTNVPSRARPEYWDVTYHFQGLEHRIQMTLPPGDYVTVNERGEPRE